MKLFDFVRRAAVTPAAPQPATPTLTGKSPEEIIDSAWVFQPISISSTDSPLYSTESIQSMSLIHIARSLEQIADDAEAIRKHLTRLQLVVPPPAQEPPE